MPIMPRDLLPIITPTPVDFPDFDPFANKSFSDFVSATEFATNLTNLTPVSPTNPMYLLRDYPSTLFQRDVGASRPFDFPVLNRIINFDLPNLTELYSTSFFIRTEVLHSIFTNRFLSELFFNIPSSNSMALSPNVKTLKMSKERFNLYFPNLASKLYTNTSKLFERITDIDLFLAEKRYVCLSYTYLKMFATAYTLLVFPNRLSHIFSLFALTQSQYYNTDNNLTRIAIDKFIIGFKQLSPEYQEKIVLAMLETCHSYLNNPAYYSHPTFAGSDGTKTSNWFMYNFCKSFSNSSVPRTFASNNDFVRYFAEPRFPN